MLTEEQKRKELLRRDIDEIKSNFTTFRKSIADQEQRAVYIPNRPKKWTYLYSDKSR